MRGDARCSGLGVSTLVLLLSSVAAVAYTYPLVFHLRDSLPYAYGVSPERRVQALVPGDPLQFYYALALTDDMARGKVPWFEDPYQFSAPRAPERKSYFFLPFSLLFSLLAPLGRATAYDLLALLSFPATALSTFWLSRRVGSSNLGATVAAAAVTLVPYRVANVAGGHPAGIAFFLLPLALLALEAAWQTRSAWKAAGAGACFLCLAVNEPHFLFFFVFLIPLWLLSAFWRVEPSHEPRGTGRALGWLVLAALGPAVAWMVHEARHDDVEWPASNALALFGVTTALLALVWRIAGEIRARAGAPDWRAEARSYTPLLVLSAYPAQIALDVPHLGAALAAAALFGVALGKLPLLGALVRIFRRVEYRDAARRLRVLWPAALGFAGAVWLLLAYKASFIDPAGKSAGRSLHDVLLFAPKWSDFFFRANTVLGHELYTGVAVLLLAVAALGSPRGRALIAVALPFAALTLGPNAPTWLPLHAAAFHLVPFFAIIRQSAKLFAIVAIALGLAAGIGADWLRGRLGRGRGEAAVLLLLALLLVDFATVLPFGVTRLPQANRVYDEIARRAPGTNLLELPLWPGDSAFSSIYQYWATRTRVPMINGYSPTVPRGYVEGVYRPLASMNLGELTEAQSRQLDDLDVRFVTLHRDTYPPQVSLFPYRFALEAMRLDPNLRPIANDDGVHLFERVAGAYRPWSQTAPWKPGVFFEAESLEIGAGRRVVEAGASAGHIVRADASVEHPVVFGPYRMLPRGRYLARFRARGSGRVEVTTDAGSRPLASSPVDAKSWDETDLRVEIESPAAVEFRAWSNGPGREPLALDWVLVTKEDGSEPRLIGGRFEAEDLTALYGGDRESPEASGGAYAIVAEEVPGKVVRDGPYREIPAGMVLVTLRSRAGALRLRIESADGLRRFGDWLVPGRPDWTEFAAEVQIPEPTVVSTRLVSAGERAEVDYVEIGAGGSNGGH